MDSSTSTIEREVLNWPGVTSEPGRLGTTSFRYGKREIGHVHRDRIADLPVTREMREEILARGRARPHRAGVKGYISYPIENPEDVSEVLEILGRNYDRAKIAAQRRGSQASGNNCGGLRQRAGARCERGAPGGSPGLGGAHRGGRRTVGLKAHRALC